MNRTLLAAVVATVALSASCPETTDNLGHAPKKQVDDARVRANAAGAKDQARANDAAAIKE